MTYPQEFTARVLRLFDRHDQHSSLFWRAGEKHGGGQFNDPASFFADCSDVFHWGCSDLEEITPENIDILEQSFADCHAAGPRLVDYGVWLFAARVRRIRPQGAVYGAIDQSVRPLFDACGPFRPAGVGNPVASLSGEPEEPPA